MSHLQCDRRRRLTVSFFVSIFSSRMCGDGRVVCLWVGCANIFWQHFTIIFLQIHNKWVLVFGSGDWSFLYRWRAGFVALNRLHEVTKIGIKTRFCCLLSKLRLGFFVWSFDVKYNFWRRKWPSLRCKYSCLIHKDVAFTCACRLTDGSNADLNQAQFLSVIVFLAWT